MNVGIGYYSLQDNTSGFGNVGVGYFSLNSNNTGSNNVAIGSSALFTNTTGNSNTGIGVSSLSHNTTGLGNTAIGLYSLLMNETGNFNTVIGLEAGRNSIGHRNIFLGYQAGYSETGNDKLYIDNSNTSTPLIYGDFNTNELTINGSLETTGGVTNTLGGADGLVKTGTKTKINNTGGGIHYGSITYLQGTGNGKQYGSNIIITNSGDGNQYADFLNLSGAGTGNKYGVYSTIASSAGGTHYGIYSNAQKSGSYSGYFLGNFKVTRTSSGNILSTIEASSGDADLFIKSTGTNNPGVHYYLDNSFRASTGYSVSNNAYFVYHNGNTYFKNGNILPDGHRTRNLGASGTAWNNLYAHNYVTEGSAAYTDRKVTNEIIAHPPVAKKDGDFDDKSDGLYELNPQSLPKNLHTENGLKIDEIATYNYKANYEQQVQINEQQKQIDLLKKQLETQQKIINQLIKKNQD
jgi:hypothetical protein